jgi:hypothetical protein
MLGFQHTTHAWTRHQIGFDLNKLLQRFLFIFSLLTVGFYSGDIVVSAVKSDRGMKMRNQNIQSSERTLQNEISRLFEALNHRDLETIKSQISPSRIYVEISDKTGAYLTNSQTLAVMESFLRSHNSLSAKFEFDNSDGENGSASGTLTASRDGHTIAYKLNFGFTKNPHGNWLLTRISMR